MTGKSERAFRPFGELPLFASEKEIAGALMGPGRYAEWRQVAPLLEERGFPKIDGLMGGRYTPAIRAFFDRDYRVTGKADTVAASPHRPADLGAWARKRKQRR